MKWHLLILMIILTNCQFVTEISIRGVGKNLTLKHSDKIYDAMPKTLQDKAASYQDKKNKEICFNYFDNLDQFKKSTGLARFCERYKEEYLKKNDQ